MEVRRDRQTLSGEDDDEEDDSGHVYEDDLCNVHNDDNQNNLLS